MVSIDIDVSLFFQMANFLILMVALNYLLYKPIRGIIRERAAKIAALGSDIASTEEGAQAKEREMERELAEARRQGAAARDEMKGEGHQREREIIDAATAEMGRAVEEVRSQIQADLGRARDELKSQVQVFGQDLAQKLLGRSIQ
ncbi:MAG: ATP synthase F0 subunit B [Deltaproteobacteria bacterium]|nr:ATP synthase F0 subunit B [Deltaproteobacteria bacterium]